MQPVKGFLFLMLKKYSPNLPPAADVTTAEGSVPGCLSGGRDTGVVAPLRLPCLGDGAWPSAPESSHAYGGREAGRAGLQGRAAEGQSPAPCKERKFQVILSIESS